jgi:hypothetical protein
MEDSLRFNRPLEVTVGALLQLFERYPTLTTWLSQQIKQQCIVLEELGTEGRLHTRLRAWRVCMRASCMSVARSG